MNNYVFDQVLACEDFKELYLYECPVMKFVGKQDLTLPMLPPPKRFLMAGSVYWVSDNVKYTFTGKDHRDPFATTLNVNKFHNIDDKKLRLLKINYYFLRDKNAMSEVKSGFKSLVYNAEKKALYLIRAVPNNETSKKGNLKRSWNKSIYRISINHSILDVEMATWDFKLREKFVSSMFKIVSKDVPGVKVECNGQVASIISLLIQHKAGCVIPGLNDTCIANLSFMASRQFMEGRVSLMERESSNHQRLTSWQQQENNIRNLRRKSSYKFIPTLGETTSLRKALTVLLGECYVGIIPKIIFDINLNECAIGQMQTIIKYKTQVPKSIQHYVSNSLGNMSKDKFKALFREVLDLARTPVEDNVKDNWIRTTRRLGEPVPWRAWADTYRMAGQLGIRIRPNSFSSIPDIWAIHDRLSNVIRRQNRIAFGINIDSKSRFIEVKYPSMFKEYKFIQLMTPEDLVKETEVMGHCVHSYKTDCAKGHSIIFSVIAPDKRRYTVEYTGNNFHFAQAEGSHADNGGMRNICEGPILNDVFIPFAKVLSNNNYKFNYQTASTLNLSIIESKQDIDALESLLELHPTDINDVYNTICRRNALLEDLLTIQKDFNNDKYLNSAPLVDDVEEAIHRHGFDGKNSPNFNPPRPMEALVPRAAERTPVLIPTEERNTLVMAEEEDEGIPY